MRRTITGAEDFRKFVKEQRKKMKLTQLEFSEDIGMTQTTLCHIERGSTRIQLATVLKILDGLGYRMVIEEAEEDE